jgi:hypothetical protein
MFDIVCSPWGLDEGVPSCNGQFGLLGMNHSELFTVKYFVYQFDKGCPWQESVECADYNFRVATV